MREPGARRRNPLFDDGDDGADRAWDDGRARDDDHHGAAADDGTGPGAGGSPRGPGLDAAVTDLARALQAAQPEAAEHLVAAAHELVLAVKTVVDAAESTLAAQRRALAAARPAGAGGADDLGDAPRAARPADPDAHRAAGRPPDRRSRVRPIDLA